MRHDVGIEPQADGLFRGLRERASTPDDARTLADLRALEENVIELWRVVRVRSTQTRSPYFFSSLPLAFLMRMIRRPFSAGAHTIATIQPSGRPTLMKRGGQRHVEAPSFMMIDRRKYNSIKSIEFKFTSTAGEVAGLPTIARTFRLEHP